VYSALLKLIGLRVRAAGRRIVRGLKTPRGAILFLVGGAMFVLWLGPVLFVGVTGDRGDPEVTRAAVPMFLLAMCVWTIVFTGGEKAIYFSPGELNFLLAGPFTRRELLAYKIFVGLLSAMASAVFFLVVFLRNFPWWLAAYIGIVLSLLLVQLLSISCVLVAQIIGERAYSRARRLALVAVVVLLAVMAWHAFGAGVGGGFSGVMQRLRESTAARGLLAVFEVFARTMTAETFYPEVVRWGGLALAVVGALVLLVLRLDADYVEASVMQSQKLYERLQRRRRGGFTGWSGKATTRGRLPQLPWLGGAGPIAWRQLLSALRHSRGLLIALAIMAVVACPILVIARDERSFGPLLGALAWMSVFLTQRMTFDFRGDLDQIDGLKSLPLRSTAITLGQLVTPALILTALQMIVVVMAVVWLRVAPGVLWAGAVVALPFNLILFEIDNFLFLLFPSRQMAGNPTDFQFLGRSMLMLFAKMVILGVAGGLAVGVGFVVYKIVGRGWLVMGLAAATVLAAFAAILVPWIAWAFRRFDVSTETPP
jgi:Putative ABC exporter